MQVEVGYLPGNANYLKSTRKSTTMKFLIIATVCLHCFCIIVPKLLIALLVIRNSAFFVERNSGTGIGTGHGCSYCDKTFSLSCVMEIFKVAVSNLFLWQIIKICLFTMSLHIRTHEGTKTWFQLLL